MPRPPPYQVAAAQWHCSGGKGTLKIFLGSDLVLQNSPAFGESVRQGISKAVAAWVWRHADP
eukprot:4424228-Amphidinium_carterae.2